MPNHGLPEKFFLALAAALAGTGLVGLGVDLFNGVDPDPIPADVFTAMMAFGFTLGFFVWLKRRPSAYRMKETIRQHFERVQKNLTRVLVGVGAVLVLLLAFQFPHTSLTRSFLHAIGVVLVLAVPGLVFTSFMYRCPRCRASFRKLRIQQLGFRADPRMHWELWNECPRCHISFDDPWPH